jgi:hypothetical protein
MASARIAAGVENGHDVVCETYCSCDFRTGLRYYRFVFITTDDEQYGKAGQKPIYLFIVGHNFCFRFLGTELTTYFLNFNTRFALIECAICAFSKMAKPKY